MITPLLNAIAPLVVMMALGWGLKQRWVSDDSVWAGLESIVYYVLMPALLFSTISRAELTGLPWGHLLLVLYLPILIMGALALVPMAWRTHLSPAVRSSLFQGITRFNLYISLSLGVSLLDPQSFALLGLLAGAIVVLVNVLCVSTLVTLNAGQVSWRKTGIAIASNPLVLACLAGALANATQITLGIPEFLWLTLERLGQTALPLSLLAIGAGLSLERFSQNLSLNLYSGFAQLLLKPALAAGLVWLTGLDTLFGLVIVLLLATPTAPSSYILARKLGGDTSTMASMIVFQTLVGLGTLLAVLTLWQVVTGIRLT